MPGAKEGFDIRSSATPRPRAYTCPGRRGGVKPGGWDDDPGSQGMIPRHFKRKKIFVTNGRTKDGQTDVTVEIVM